MMKTERPYKTSRITPDMERYIKEHHKTETPVRMAHSLKCSEQTIRNYLHRFGLSVLVHRWSKDNKVRLARMLSRGESVYAIAKYFGVTESNINKEKRILINQGILIP